MKKKTLYASFIGINAYPTNKLYACVHDVLKMDQFLRKFTAQQGLDQFTYAPAYWLAPHNEDVPQLAEYQAKVPDFKWAVPTYAHIKDQKQGPFAHLKDAKPGDICLFFYSGHGSYVEAPEVFWGDKSNRRNETIVCVDSRSNPEARDLIDKEMAYLIWDALSDSNDPKKLKEDVHCLVIMDCCHSGSNFRDDEIDPKKIRFRNESAAKNRVKAEEYLGWKEGFFELDGEGKAKFPIAPYVHLAAARDDEKALETNDGGLFSTCLLKQLEAGGTGRTYRDLMSSLSVEVRNRADKQNPVSFAFEDKDLDHPFLSRETVPYRATYPVNFIGGEWLMQVGKIDGLTPSGAQGDNLVKISGVEPLVKVTEVRNDQSVLDHTVLESLNQDDTYEALLVHLASPKLKVGLSVGLLESTELLGNLKQAYGKEAPLFFAIDFSNLKEACDYLVRITLEGEYVLTKNNSSIPLFKRSKDPQVFLRYVDSVGKWLSTSELSNQDTRFSADDFVFTVEKIEGKPFGSNPDGVSGERVDQDGKLPDELVAQYKGTQQPAFRLSMSINPDSSLMECYVGVLYLRSRFGIKMDFIDPSENKLFKGGDPIYLQLKDQNRLYRTIPFVLSEAYKVFNINEITAYLKILVANDPQTLNLQRFQQADLPLDDSIPIYRGDKNFDDDELGFSRDSLGDQRDWTVFTMKIRVVGPNKEKQIENRATDFTSFVLRSPEGFQAKAYAATGDDQHAKLNKNKRHKGVDSTSVLANRVAPPTHLFNGVLTDNNPFPAGLSSASDNSVQVLELRPSQDDAQFPTLQGGQKLTIIPKTKPIRQRSVDDTEEQYAESILPYGYDETTGLYFPIGYTDAEGNIQIEQLPPPSDGLIQGDEPLTRGLGQSIKLYFKKVFTRKPSEALCLHWRDEQGQWQKVTKAPEIQQKLAGQQQAKVVLAIHGITGDTEWMLAGLQELHAQGTQMDFILTYDYESLATPIETTADKLYKRLDEAGFGKEDFPALTVVAHSMGGLITRHLLEVDKKGAFIQHLIMLGTPNDGSEVAGLRDQVYGLITDALNVGGVMKLSIAGLAYVLNLFGANPVQALGQLIPGSPVLKVLGRTPKPPIPYSIISGNINKITEEVAAGNPFLERLVDHIKGKAVYPALSKFVFKDNHHDMAVTVDSMATIRGFDPEQQIEVGCDHVGYFDSAECLGVLKGLI